MSSVATDDQASGPVADRIVADLVRAGLLGEQDRAAAVRVVAADLADAGAATPVPEQHSVRRRVAEIAGYVGAALVLGAVGLFLAQQWSSLSHGARVGILAVAAAALAVAGGALSRRLPVPRREAEHSVQGRLAGVLLASAAVSAAFAVALAVGSGPASGAGATFAFGATLLGTAVAGYLVVPGAIEQLAAAVGAVVLVPATLDLAGDVTAVAAGLLLLGLGVLWLLLGERGVWRPVAAARPIGCAIAFAGAQVPVSGSHPWVGYVATAVLAASAFAGYAVLRAWPYLVLGVLATTVAAPEALSDWTGGSLGAAGALLVAGVALLGASLAGLRLRREVTGK